MIKLATPFKQFPSVTYSYELIMLSVEASRRMIFSYLLLYLILLPWMFYFIPLPVFLVWIGMAFGHIIFRYIVTKNLSLSLEHNYMGVDKYLRLSIYTSLCGGMLWGSLGWLNLLYLPHMYHYITIAVLLGIAAAAVATLSMIFISYLTFLLSMMSIQIIALWFVGGLDDFIISLMVVAYVIVIIPTARLLYTRTKESFELTATLKESKEELASLNGTLEERVKEKTQALHHNYYHDQLTGLPNLKKLSELMIESEKNYVVLLDIREFSLLNKQYGKAIIDRLLVLISKHLNQHLHKNISLFRAESDRFIIYCMDSTRQEVEEYFKQILSYFKISPIVVDSFDIQINFKAGISDMSNIEECLIYAEYALMLAKKKGEDYITYDISEEELKAEKEIISFLSRTKELILDEKIYPVFQPIYDISRQSIVKYECLARGDLHGEMMLPCQFLAGAKRLGLTTNITHIMINKCFVFFKDNTMEFSINITEPDLLNPNFINFLDIKLKRYNMDPSRVTFEVLENITTHNQSNSVLDALHSLKQRGCKIAIDDFGVENSNFSRLLEIDLDLIKIDGLFIKNIHISEKDKKVVQAIVGLARTLGVETVAEFVENEEVLKTLIECGVDYAQGYYIGKPEKYLLEELELITV